MSKPNLKLCELVKSNSVLTNLLNPQNFFNHAMIFSKTCFALKKFTCTFVAANTVARYDSSDLNPKTRYAIVKAMFHLHFYASKSA